VVKSSEIEGEKLDAQAVRSSIARRLGMDVGAVAPADRNVEGVVEMMLDATRNYDKALTEERLFGWHASLFPTGRSGMRRIRVGMWRDDQDGPMQVVSGAVGRERVHFEAPAAARLEEEMGRFLEWFNSGIAVDPVLKAGMAHLWFVTIHPFDDGNGRIARAIADLCLARSEQSAQRFYSMSAQIRQRGNEYYDMLEKTQKSGTEITEWQMWLLGCLGRAIDGAETLLGSVLRKARFWESVGSSRVNERQRLVLNKLLDGFEGKLTTTKWAKLTKSSQDTAYRDILELVDRGILARSAEGGRSTSYELVEFAQASKAATADEEPKKARDRADGAK
jgi:Fic family protein